MRHFVVEQAPQKFFPVPRRGVCGVNVVGGLLEQSDADVDFPLDDIAVRPVAGVYVHGDLHAQVVADWEGLCDLLHLV